MISADFRAACDRLSSRSVPGELKPGKVDRGYFILMMNLIPQRSDALVKALEDVLVRGMTRKEACALYGVSASNLSVKLARLQVVSQTIARMYPCHADRTDCPVSRHLLAPQDISEH